jgi:NADP-dependent 3-hydroxy acid dehydrogenase YdfG
VHGNGHDGPDLATAGATPLALLDDLHGRRAVVTGAARGIGEAIAKWLIMAGADVTVIDKDSLIKDVFRAEYCQVMEADLAREDVVGLAEELTARQPVELLVNNVGITTPHGHLQVGALEVELVLGTNLTGPWLFTDRLVKALIEDQTRTSHRHPSRRGSIVFISSLHDRFVAEDAHYGVSKAGVPCWSGRWPRTSAGTGSGSTPSPQGGSGRPPTPPPPSRWPSTPACGHGSRSGRPASPPTSPGPSCQLRVRARRRRAVRSPISLPFSWNSRMARSSSRAASRPRPPRSSTSARSRWASARGSSWSVRPAR